MTKDELIERLKEYGPFANLPTDGEDDQHALIPHHNTPSDAAYLDECAMRIAAGMVAAGTHIEPQRELGSATAQIAYRIADAMLAERKRRREGGA